MSKPRLAVIATHPIQYQAPVWRELYGQGVDLEVMYASMDGVNPYFDKGFGKTIQWDVPVLEGYPWRQLKSRSLASLNWRFRYCISGLDRVLKEGGFTHLLLPGKEFWFYHQALWAARRQGVRVLYRAESHPERQGRFGQWLAGLSRRYWYGRIDSFLYVGRYQAEEYERAGVERGKMCFSPYCVDDRHFEAQRNAVDRNQSRDSWGFSPDTFVVGYSGKLYDRKNPMAVIRAAARLSVSGCPCRVLMVGDGPLRAECEAVGRSLMPDGVVFTGFLNQGELGKAYAAMDVLAIPSWWETWGLVMNEGMIFGLPVVAADAVNAARELIAEGWNGYVYPEGDEAELVDRLARVHKGLSAGIAFAERSRRRVNDYSVRAAAYGIMDAIGMERTFGML